jgi:hypothetical protein
MLLIECGGLCVDSSVKSFWGPLTIRKQYWSLRHPYCFMSTSWQRARRTDGRGHFLRDAPVEGLQEEVLLSILGTAWVHGPDHLPPLKVDISDGLLSLHSGNAYFFENPDYQEDYNERKEYGQLLISGKFTDGMNFFMGTFHTTASFRNIYEGHCLQNDNGSSVGVPKGAATKQEVENDPTACSTTTGLESLVDEIV